MLKTRAAICWDINTDWSVEEIEIDPPKEGEVLVRIGGSGMCHSDEHIVTGDLVFDRPIIGGHEGAGEVVEVGPGVRDLAPGDHVVFGFLPACGRCPSCSSGHSNLCDMGMYMAEGLQIADHTSRHHARGQDLRACCMIGTFAEYTVANVASCIKIDDDVPVDVACLLGCGVVTGWGSAVNAGEVGPGDTVVVVGVGGVGINAVQGAALAGAERIFAVDPVEFKREKAMEFGATDVAADIDSAFEMLEQATRGRLANVVINTKGLGVGADIGHALRLAGKRGKVVVTNVHNYAENEVALSPIDLVLMEKQVRGALFGSSNPRSDIPRLLDLYRNGKLMLNELITKRYQLDEVNEGFADMRDGKNLRGVITF